MLCFLDSLIARVFWFQCLVFFLTSMCSVFNSYLHNDAIEFIDHFIVVDVSSFVSPSA